MHVSVLKSSDGLSDVISPYISDLSCCYDSKINAEANFCCGKENLIFFSGDLIFADDDVSKREAMMEK